MTCFARVYAEGSWQKVSAFGSLVLARRWAKALAREEARAFEADGLEFSEGDGAEVMLAWHDGDGVETFETIWSES